MALKNTITHIVEERDKFVLWRVSLLVLLLAGQIFAPSVGYSAATKYYKTVTAVDPAICAHVVKSLNRQDHSIRGNPLNSAAIADALLSSDLQLGWKRLDIRNSTLILDYVRFRTAAGERETAFRWSGYVHGFGESALMISTANPAEFFTGDTADESVFGKIRKASEQIKPDFDTTSDWNKERDAPENRDTIFYLNLIQLKDQLYVLATQSTIADEVVYRHRQLPLEVYLLRYDSRDKMPMICHYREAAR